MLKSKRMKFCWFSVCLRTKFILLCFRVLKIFFFCDFSSLNFYEFCPNQSQNCRRIFLFPLRPFIVSFLYLKYPSLITTSNPFQSPVNSNPASRSAAKRFKIHSKLFVLLCLLMLINSLDAHKLWCSPPSFTFPQNLISHILKRIFFPRKQRARKNFSLRSAHNSIITDFIAVNLLLSRVMLFCLVLRKHHHHPRLLWKSDVTTTAENFLMLKMGFLCNLFPSCRTEKLSFGVWMSETLFRRNLETILRLLFRWKIDVGAINLSAFFFINPRHLSY